MSKTLLFPLALLTFIAAIFAVRMFDTSRIGEAHRELSCPQGMVLVFDTSRNFVCLSGTVPHAG